MTASARASMTSERLSQALSDSAEQSASSALIELSYYESQPLSDAEKALVMQGWNKVLAFRTAFSEALLIYWRILCCNEDDALEDQASSASLFGSVEKNEDPIYRCLKDRMPDAEELLMGLVDGAIRSLCPHRQTVQREAYRPIMDETLIQRSRNEFYLECQTLDDHLSLFARLGVPPNCWVLFIQAFLWTMKTHTPYAQDDDHENLDLGQFQSAFARSIALTVSIPAVMAYRDLVTLHKAPVVKQIQTIWGRLSEDGMVDFGEAFYRNLLSDYPELLDFFAKTDMDSLAVHLSQTLDLVVKNVHLLGSTGSFRVSLDALGQLHRKMNIPTYSYALVGASILSTILPLFEKEEEATKGTESPVLAEDLRAGLGKVYGNIMSIVYYPMLRQEKLIAKAREFYEMVGEELHWSDGQLQARMHVVEEEVALTGTYVQTGEELEIGARLAWRNSAKCVGRIAWNTLKIRDCRHINDPASIFEEVRKHLLEATAGTNIQSIMTVFKPQEATEPLGTRFWSSQCVRYAGYKDFATGKIIGDPANLELTEYLTREKYWIPPLEKTPFDVLPIVLKFPGNHKPFVHQLPKDCIFEVPLEHPTNPKFDELKLRWTTVPAISNFKMNLGGVVYQNMPFNGWFLSTEIVRNLMERYEVGPKIAGILGLDLKTDPIWQNSASCELERMVVYSFRKNGYTIVDPMAVGKSFCTHVQRERGQFGRECPGQWSWIGGLLGPNNPTWHLEMRDFLVNPQYEYCADSLLLHEAARNLSDDTTFATCTNSSGSVSMSSTDSDSPRVQIPRVLIVYGSETGNAEAVARRVKRDLAAIKPLLKPLNEVKGLEIVKEKKITHVLGICSTFGKGHAPANAQEFFCEEIKGVEEGTKFAVLALGSTIYPDFCQAGVKLDRLLESSGLERFVGIVKIDEAAGEEDQVDEWISRVRNQILPPHIHKYLAEAAGLLDETPIEYSLRWLEDQGEIISHSENIGSICLSNVELVDGPGSNKSIRKITFEVPSTYESGDNLAVQPVNSDQMVTRFLKCFENDQGSEFEPADVFFSNPTTLEHILKYDVDLSLRAKDVPGLLNLVQTSIDAKLSNIDKVEQQSLLEVPAYQTLLGLSGGLASSEKSALTDQFIASYPTIVNFLESFQEILLGAFFDDSPALYIAQVLVILNRLQPRYYSISSSNKVDDKVVSISVGVLNEKTSMGVPIEGVCSNYLAKLRGGIDRASIRVAKSTFRLPSDVNAPIIMVGAGTGLAPMIGFLQEKALDAEKGVKSGPIHLFFGCRTENDFIYKDLIGRYEKQGLLKLHLALSRSKQSPKSYVQDKIKEMGKELAELILQSDTHYYVCGDARMADACYEECLGLVRRHGTMSRVSAASRLRKMRISGRWQTDVWGIVSHFETAKKDVMKNKRTAAKLWMSHFGNGEV